MTTAPAELTYGYVDGRLILVVGDTSDAGRMPDPVPATGTTVQITPKQPLIRIAGDDPTIVVKQPITCTLDEDGRLLDPEGERGVWLVTGVYTVTYRSPKATIPTHEIVVTSAHTEESPLDLTLAMPPGGPVLSPSQYAELSARIDALDGVPGAGGPGTPETLITTATYTVTEPGDYIAQVSTVIAFPDLTTRPLDVGDFAVVRHLAGTWYVTLGSLTPGGADDDTPPVGGTLGISGITATSFTMTVTGATDPDSGLDPTPYRFSTNGGASWTPWQAAATWTVTGLSGETTYSPRAQVRNAAALAATLTAPDVTTDVAPPSVDYAAYDSVVSTHSPLHAVQLDGSARITTGTVTVVGSVTFDGVGATAPTVDDYVQVDGTSTLGTAANQISACTIETVIWVEAHNPTTRYLCGVGTSRAYLSGSNAAGTTLRSAAIGSTAVATGRPVHVVGTYDGATTRCYVDGTEVAQVAATGTISNSTDGLRGATGILDAVKVGRFAYYGRALTAAEIAAHADALP